MEKISAKTLTTVKLISVGVAAAGLFAGLTFMAAQAQAVPLSVTCSGTASDNVITWTASPAGGDSPYTYLWSGDQVAGNTSSSVTGTYNATGTYDAMIQVTDASSSIATSTCSANVTSMPAPTSTTPSADISITKTVDNMSPATNTDVNYMLTVSALGPDTSTGVMASDLLPSGLTFENATASVGTYDSSTGIWTIGDMIPSSTATLAIEAMVNGGTEGTMITNTADVSESSTENDPNTANNMAVATLTVQSAPTSTTMPTAGLSITKTVDNMNPATNTDVNYLLTVSALGPDTSTGAMATDLLPTGLTFENATASMGSYNSSTGMWAIGNMTPSSTATLMIEALINPGTQGDIITNSATVGEASSVMNTSDNTSAAATLTVQSAPTSTTGGGGGGGGGGGTPTSTTPLAASCDWTVGSSPNIITWLGTASGGTTPYSYLWTGNDIPAGSTSSSVTVTYPAPGAYFATFQANDAASSSASAACSISIGSTSPKTAPQSLMIGPRGAFDGQRMVVLSTSHGSFQAMIWGITYTINWSRVRPVLAAGDVVNVIGKVTTATPLVVTANDVTRS